MKFENKEIVFVMGACILAMPFCFLIFGSFTLRADSLFGTIFFGLLAISGLLVPVVLLKTGRQWFSYFVVDEKGITNKIYFLKNKDIFIPWGEVKDIAIKPIGKGHGVYSEYMYFCKEPLDEHWNKMKLHKTFIKIPAYQDSYGLGQDKDLLTISYSERLLDEVLKYIDKDRIKKFDGMRDRVS